MINVCFTNTPSSVGKLPLGTFRFLFSLASVVVSDLYLKDYVHVVNRLLCLLCCIT